MPQRAGRRSERDARDRISAQRVSSRMARDTQSILIQQKAPPLVPPFGRLRRASSDIFLLGR